jgi:hypothetical protein
MTRHPRLRRRWRLAVLVPLILPAGLHAQAGADVQISSGVEPAEVTVGDPFRAGIRVSAPVGVEVRFPAFSDPAGTLQSTEPPRRVADPQDPRTFVQVYPLVAWRTAVVPPVLPVELHLPDGSVRVVRLELPVPTVRSVLPAEAEALEPMDHRGIVDAQTAGARWPWLLLALAVLAALAAAAYRILRRRRPAPTLGENPREWALAELERARSELPRSADRRPFFSAVSGALRGYVASASPSWGTDLTTRELVETLLADGAGRARVERLHRVLATADGVKFARIQLSEADARGVWAQAHEWVEEGGVAAPADEAAAGREAA